MPAPKSTGVPLLSRSQKRGFMPRAQTRRAKALPTAPVPRMAQSFPASPVPSIWSMAHPFHAPERARASPSLRRRARARSMASARSAMASVAAPAVVATAMPRRAQASMGRWSTPVEQVPRTFSLGA